MKNKAISLLMTATFIFGLTGCTGNMSDDPNPKKEIIILAAASLTDVMSDIETQYESQHDDVDLVFSFAGSGALQTQIEEGAPADIFISASTVQMDALRDEGLMDEGSVRDLLRNEVVLIVPADSDIAIDSFEDVTSDEVSMIGIGDVDSVPAGQYARDVFTSLGIWDEVSAKANFGNDVRAILTWVEESAVTCGVVYATDAYTSDKVRIVASAPEGSCEPVIYPVGITSSSNEKDGANEFVEYLSSDEATDIFGRYGFAPAG